MDIHPNNSEETPLKEIRRIMDELPLIMSKSFDRAPPTDETRISIDDSKEIQEAPSPQEPKVAGLAAASIGAEPYDETVPEDWEKLGLLYTVKAGDEEEIRRLRGLVDTRLHSAVLSGDLARLRTLLDEGARPEALDWHGMTPLHLCVSRGLLKPLTVLLSCPGAVDVRDASGLPLLHVALLYEWRAGVQVLLCSDVRVDAHGPGDVSFDRVLDRCRDKGVRRYQKIMNISFIDALPRTGIEVAFMSDMKMLSQILWVAKKTGVVDCPNAEGKSALHTAIWFGNMEAVKVLISNGASVNRVSDKNDTVLHAAILKPQIMQYLLENTEVKNSLNSEGFAPEHEAVRCRNVETLILLLDKFQSLRVKSYPDKMTPLHLAAKTMGDEVPKAILERATGSAGFIAMLEDRVEGYTPLHLAAACNNRDMVALLLLNGANLSTKTTGLNQTTVLELISTNFYKADSFLELVFDGFIYDVDPNGSNRIHAVYPVITDGLDLSQIKALEEFVRCGRSKALKHPLVESLLYLKWKHFQPLFFTLLAIYGLFLVSFNSLMIYVFHFDGISNETAGDEDAGLQELYGGFYWLLVVLTYIFLLILLMQESMFFYCKGCGYWSVESCVKLGALALCACAPWLARAPGAWPRHVACAALLLAWLQAMLLVSRFPRWGYYVLMFGKVAANVLKVLVTSIFLVIGFALCFMIQYRSVAPFDGPFSAFVKTLVMMTSEFDYEGLFGEDHADQLRDSEIFVRILFVVFVIFVAIVLMNFMIGVAVTDIDELTVTGNIKRLEKQVELLSTFEPLAYEGFLSKWFIKLFGDKRYHDSISTSRGNQSSWRVNLRTPSIPSKDSYDIQIRSSKLYTAILETPSRRDLAEKKARRDGTDRPYKSRLNVLYNAVNEKPEVSRRGEGSDLVDRKVNEFDSIVLEQNLLSLVEESSRMTRDVEELRQYNAFVNVQIRNLSELSMNALRRLRFVRDLTALERKTRRPRRRAARTNMGEHEQSQMYILRGLQ